MSIWRSVVWYNAERLGLIQTKAGLSVTLTGKLPSGPQRSWSIREEAGSFRSEAGNDPQPQSNGDGNPIVPC